MFLAYVASERKRRRSRANQLCSFLLFYYLRKGKTGYQSTPCIPAGPRSEMVADWSLASVDHVIERLIMTVIETCSAGAVVCVS